MDESRFENYVEYACSIRWFAGRQRSETLADALADQYFVHAVIGPEILQELIRCSEKYTPARDALGIIGCRLRRKGMPLPDKLADWLVKLEELGGHRVRPKPRGEGPYANYYRNAFILKVVSDLFREENVRPTRAGGGPTECCPDGGTGCDVAGVALLREDNKAPKYKSIEEIWGRRNKRMTHIAFELTSGGLSVVSYRGYRESYCGEFYPEEDGPEEWNPDEHYEEQCIKEGFGDLYDLLGGKSYGKYYDVAIGTILTRSHLRRGDKPSRSCQPPRKKRR